MPSTGAETSPLPAEAGGGWSTTVSDGGEGGRRLPGGPVPARLRATNRQPPPEAGPAAPRPAPDEGDGEAVTEGYAPFRAVAQDAPSRMVSSGCGPSVAALILLTALVILVLMAIASYRNAPP